MKLSLDVIQVGQMVIVVYHLFSFQMKSIFLNMIIIQIMVRWIIKNVEQFLIMYEFYKKIFFDYFVIFRHVKENLKQILLI